MELVITLTFNIVSEAAERFQKQYGSVAAPGFGGWEGQGVATCKVGGPSFT